MHKKYKKTENSTSLKSLFTGSAQINHEHLIIRSYRFVLTLKKLFQAGVEFVCTDCDLIYTIERWF